MSGKNRFLRFGAAAAAAALLFTMSATGCGASAGGDETFESLTLQREEVHVSVPGMKQTLRIAYLSDLHVLYADESVDPERRAEVEGRVQSFANGRQVSSADQWPLWVAWLNREKPDYVLFGGDMVDYASGANVSALQEGLDALQVPYMYLRADHDTEPFYLLQGQGVAPAGTDSGNGVFVQEYDAVILVGWDNATSQLSEAGYAAIEEAFGRGKPVVLVTHVPIEPQEDTSLADASRAAFGNRSLLWGFGDNYYYPEGATRDLLRLIYAEDTPIVEVLSGHLHFTWDGAINARVHEHVFGPAFQGCAGIVTIGP